MHRRVRQRIAVLLGAVAVLLAGCTATVSGAGSSETGHVTATGAESLPAGSKSVQRVPVHSVLGDPDRIDLCSLSSGLELPAG